MKTDHELIILMKNHPEKGLELFMRQFLGLVYTIVHSKLSSIASPADVEECVSGIFYEVYCQLPKIDLQKGSLKAYLATVAKRKAIDQFRQLTKKSGRTIAWQQLDYDPPSEDVGLEEFVLHSETKTLLIKEIKALGEPDSEIFIRKYYLGQSTKDIARDLKIKENTIDKKVSRGLHKLRDALGGAR